MELDEFLRSGALGIRDRLDLLVLLVFLTFLTFLMVVLIFVLSSCGMSYAVHIKEHSRFAIPAILTFLTFLSFLMLVSFFLSPQFSELGAQNI